VVRAPRHRQTLHTFESGKVDYCFVRLHKRGRPLVAMAPVTRAGRTYLDELQTVSLMSFVPFVSADEHDSRTNVLPYLEQS
jgi:hypothetical protein